MTTKLTDLQLVLLSSAAARADGSLLPPADSVAGQRSRIARAIPPLLKRKLVAEVDVIDPAQAWRDQDDRRIGVAITDAGRSAIGVHAPQPAPVSPSPIEPEQASAPESSALSAAAKPATKAAAALELLRREQGVTLAELVAANGWLPHTT